MTTLAHTGLVIVADKAPNGGAVGYVAPEAAGFMGTRHGEAYDDTFPALSSYNCGERTCGSALRRILVSGRLSADPVQGMDLTTPGEQLYVSALSNAAGDSLSEPYRLRNQMSLSPSSWKS